MGAHGAANLGALLATAARLQSRRVSAKLASFHVTAAQVPVLAIVWGEDGRSLTELAKRTGADSPTMTGVVDRLEAQGVVERRRTSQDRRVITVHLTDAGRGLQEQVLPVWAATEQEALAGLTPVAVQQFTTTLRQLIANLSHDTHPDA